MFDKQIERVYQGVLSRIDASSTHIYLQELISNPRIEDAYKKYLNAEVSWWVYEERIQREIAVNFDVESKEIQDLFDSLDRAYMEKAFFDHEGLKLLVNSSVKTRLNLLVRPRTTLKWFIFRGEPTKPFVEIKKRLDYFSDYNYLRDGFLSWVKEKNIIRSDEEILSVVEFDRIIEQVDNDKIFDLSPEEFVNMTEPMFSFFNYSLENDEFSFIPAEALMLFLDDKGIFPILNSLEALYYEDKIKSITRKSLLDFLYKVLEEMDSSPQAATAKEESEKRAKEFVTGNVISFSATDQTELPSELEEELPGTDMAEEPASGPNEVPYDATAEHGSVIESGEMTGITDRSAYLAIDSPDLTVSNNALKESDEEIAAQYDNITHDESGIVTAVPEANEPAEELSEDILPISDDFLIEQIIDESLAETSEASSAETIPAVTGESAETNRDGYFTDQAQAGDKVQAPMDDIIIDEDLKQEMILNIFLSDETLYDILMEDLKSCPTWDEAKQKIEEYFFDACIDPESYHAKEFWTLVKSRF